MSSNLVKQPEVQYNPVTMRDPGVQRLDHNLMKTHGY